MGTFHFTLNQDTQSLSEVLKTNTIRTQRSPLIIESRNRLLERISSNSRIMLVLVLLLAGVMVVGAFHWSSLLHSTEGVTWRVRVFARKANGEVPDLSWSEFWQMAWHRGGFGLQGIVQGLSADEAVNNPYDTNADYQAASHFFRERCEMCHGNDGVGGDIGPALNHLSFKHGDSDLAIYQVIRDGVPNTVMRPPRMSMVERWQLVAYVRHLQHNGANSASGGAALHIDVSSDQITSAGSKTDEWLTYSGSLDGHRYTPLNQITSVNVSQLRIQWVRQFDTPLPGIEATPIVTNGVIFITEPPSDTIAVDAISAKSGDLIWRYARKVPPNVKACCGRFNRGLAILENHLYLASFEGYLVCLDADSGSVVWQTQVADPSVGYSLSVAPLALNRSVVVGVAGAEYPIRGFLAAYDGETGKKRWQFDTIPGPGEPGNETWGGNSWKTGGGSTWVTGSYDPVLDLLYWGVGNPAPGFSGDDRPGDDLYTDSVVALHASSGKLAWYFQFTPHDIYDWDSTQTPILADISIGGTARKVICWANRNGFYYVLDRVTGEFLGGAPFVEQNWAKGLNVKGRPIQANNHVSSDWRLIRPANGGATIWQNAAFDPRRGLIFVPATEGVGMSRKSLHVTPEAGELYLGSGGAFVTSTKTVPVIRALDVGTGTKKWEYFPPARLENPTAGGISYSGLLATGAGLVFGASGQSIFALDSATGRELWRVFLGGDTRAAPISFTVDGRQVVAVSVGRGLFLFGLPSKP